MQANSFISLVTFTVLISLWCISPANSEQTVVPPEFENHNGFGSQSLFDCTDLPNGSRIQILFEAQDLRPGIIVGLNNRLFEGSPGFSESIVPNVTFIMSVTDAEPNNLSNTFDENTGPNPVTIFFGDITVGPSEGCNTNPCPFIGDPLPFQTPFPYNPLQGNLLLEIITPPCVGGTPPEVLLDSTFELSAVFADDFAASEGQQGFGNIFQITYAERTPVPTLSEWGVIVIAAGFGIIGFFVARRRKAAAQ